MIKPTELRIGNHVAERGSHVIYKVLAINEYHGVMVKYWSCGEGKNIRFNRLMPLLIRAELLEAVGFKYYAWEEFLQYTHMIWQGIIVRFHEYGCSVFNICKCDNQRQFVVSVKYFHQLQNLLFLLTETEIPFL